MTLRIFEVSTDGVAKAVPKDEVRQETQPAAPQPAGPEHWAEATEWEKLRVRLSKDPQSDVRRRHDPTRRLT